MDFALCRRHFLGTALGSGITCDLGSCTTFFGDHLQPWRKGLGDWGGWCCDDAWVWLLQLLHVPTYLSSYPRTQRRDLIFQFGKATIHECHTYQILSCCVCQSHFVLVLQVKDLSLLVIVANAQAMLKKQVTNDAPTFLIWACKSRWDLDYFQSSKVAKQKGWSLR